MDVGHIRVDMPAFDSFNIQEGEAFLLLSNNTNNNRKVLMTRKAGMKIFDKNRVSGVIKFSGIFQAIGPNINKVLKEMENPNHDKWSEDRSSQKKTAKEFLNFITRFIKDAVIKHYQEKSAAEVDAYGMSDFLPDNLTDLPGKKERQGNSKTQAKVKLKTPSFNKENSVQVRAEEDGENTVDQMIQKGIIDGDSSGPIVHGSGLGQSGLGGSGQAGGSDTGNYSNDPNGNDVAVMEKVARKSISKISYRVLETDSFLGKYRIVLKSQKNLKDIKLRVGMIGDSGRRAKIHILSAESPQLGNISVKSDNLYFDNLVKNQWQGIDLKINSKNRLKLEVEVYANSQ